MQSRQVMTPNVTVVGPTTAISEIARKMHEEDIGVTLVVENDRLIGVVTGRDIVMRVVAGRRKSGSATVHDSTSTRLLYRSFREVLDDMDADQAGRLHA
jgi:CBS domain-containing protein